LAIPHPSPAATLTQLEDEVGLLLVFPPKDGCASEPIGKLTAPCEVIGALHIVFLLLGWLILVVGSNEAAPCPHQHRLEDVSEEVTAKLLL
jgi:hypothetical protein